MKSLIAATLLLSLASFSFTADATETHTYKVEQDSIKTVIAPASGLEKASCVFLDEEGDKVAGQNVTVTENYGDFVLVEANLYYEQHLSVTKIICLK
ncbi:conserved hypothetical protein [Vibrio phage 424E50-1]|nr:conserved hypothetical protein [Vibrio phage 424E50-1]